ncbi:MAG: hypothetical protein EAX96_10675 [Candidatus Lokiarchaeota archaeon]|nr:hypothetical protein [Candidatus Lokiarchaeota archaeon]
MNLPRIIRKNIIYGIAISIAILEILRLIFFIIFLQEFFLFFLFSSILLSICALIIRLWVVDVDKFYSIINETDKYSSQIGDLKPKRYLNLMPIAMITCTIADAVLPFSFIIGMLVFLTAHVILIIAFSGIIHVQPRLILSETFSDLKSFNLRTIFSEQDGNNYLISFLTIMAVAILSYIFLIFNPNDFMTIVIIPYVIIISFMVFISMIGINYTKRRKKFRYMLALGSSFFMLSDLILAINKFTIPIYGATFIIISTYLIANFLLQSASIYLTK